jgi:septation ring formation regulator EzrA
MQKIGRNFKLNKEDVIKLYKSISTEKTKGNVKFRYGLSKNNNIIRVEIDALTEIEKDIETIIDPLNKEKEKLVKEIGSLDENTNSYSIKSGEKEKIKEFNKRFMSAQENYKNIISEYNKKYGEYKEILKEELETPLKFIEINI